MDRHVFKAAFGGVLHVTHGFFLGVALETGPESPG
jgi:hypothetical protein